ncbi:MAG: pitrilysin family protein [Candidatus Omnitrophota bacterium]
MYHKTHLNNGLTIATLAMPQRESVSLGIWIKVGSRYEQSRINGISHFLEHLVFKGTQKRSCEEIKQAIEGVGGSLNAFTAEEATCYLAKVPAKFLPVALEVLWDMVTQAKLAASDVEMERKVILEEIRMYKDLPSHYVSDILAELLWPDQPLGLNIAGEKESVNAITAGQLRAYRDQFYRLNNSAVIVCGNTDHRQVIKECKKHFPLPTASKRNGYARAREYRNGPQLKLLHKDTEQTHLALGVHSLERMHPDRYALGVLHIILGANMSSRLFREVREERGLAYEIATAVKFFQDSGAFIVHAGIDNRRIGEAIEVILAQLKDIKNTPVPKEELARAKEYYIGQLSLALENTSDHMLWLGESIICAQRFSTPAEIIRSIQKIQAHDVQRLAQNLFQRQRLHLALIGPLKEKEKRAIKKRLEV